MVSTHTQSKQFARLLGGVKDAPEWLQTNIAARLALTPINQNDGQTAAIVQNMIIDSTLPPLGVDAMVQTPTAQGTQLERDELQLAQQNGRTTHTEQDIERMTFAIEAQVKQMIAAGATDADIKQAVGNLPNVTPELSQLAQQIAEQQLSAEKFNLFNQRNVDNQGQAADIPAPTLATLLHTPIIESFAKKEEPAQEAAVSPLAATEPSFGNLMWGEKPKPLTMDTANPFAALLTGDVTNDFRKALDNYTPTPGGQGQQQQEQERSGRAR
jgi:hypothetical protein